MPSPNSSALPVGPAPVAYYIARMREALEAARQQAEFYQPGSFWLDATTNIVNQLEELGLQNFRSAPLPLMFFVPTYGTPCNRLTENEKRALSNVVEGNGHAKAAIERFTSGYNDALADYRVLLAADDASTSPQLNTFSESTEGHPLEQFTFGQQRYSRSSLNYLLGLCFLKKHLGDEEINTVVEIGGGFGSLGEVLLKGDNPKTRYIDFDIPPNNIITEYYLSAVFGEEFVTGFDAISQGEDIPIDTLPAASAFGNWQIEQLTGQADLFVNFISFQEMEPPIVANYLSHVDRLQTRWILLRNMREGKQLKTATTIGVETPILTNDYIEMLPNYQLVDRCVHPFGYQTVDDFHSELLLFKRG